MHLLNHVAWRSSQTEQPQGGQPAHGVSLAAAAATGRWTHQPAERSRRRRTARPFSANPKAHVRWRRPGGRQAGSRNETQTPKRGRGAWIAGWWWGAAATIVCT
jgi:hypothetical protein